MGRPRTTGRGGERITSLNAECKVCSGPSAAHTHYGAVCCYSCRAFFRRGIHRSYHCVQGNNQCRVNSINRTNCKKCRYDRCIEVGMQPHLVDASLKKRLTHAHLANLSHAHIQFQLHVEDMQACEAIANEAQDLPVPDPFQLFSQLTKNPSQVSSCGGVEGLAPGDGQILYQVQAGCVPSGPLTLELVPGVSIPGAGVPGASALDAVVPDASIPGDNVAQIEGNLAASSGNKDQLNFVTHGPKQATISNTGKQRNKAMKSVQTKSQEKKIAKPGKPRKKKDKDTSNRLSALSSTLGKNLVKPPFFSPKQDIRQLPGQSRIDGNKKSSEPEKSGGIMQSDDNFCSFYVENRPKNPVPAGPEPVMDQFEIGEIKFSGQLYQRQSDIMTFLQQNSDQIFCSEPATSDMIDQSGLVHHEDQVEAGMEAAHDLGEEEEDHGLESSIRLISDNPDSESNPEKTGEKPKLAAKPGGGRNRRLIKQIKEGNQLLDQLEEDQKEALQIDQEFLDGIVQLDDEDGVSNLSTIIDREENKALYESDIPENGLVKLDLNEQTEGNFFHGNVAGMESYLLEPRYPNVGTTTSCSKSKTYLKPRAVELKQRTSTDGQQDEHINSQQNEQPDVQLINQLDDQLDDQLPAQSSEITSSSSCPEVDCGMKDWEDDGNDDFEEENIGYLEEPSSRDNQINPENYAHSLETMPPPQTSRFPHEFIPSEFLSPPNSFQQPSAMTNPSFLANTRPDQRKMNSVYHFKPGPNFQRNIPYLCRVTSQPPPRVTSQPPRMIAAKQNDGSLHYLNQPHPGPTFHHRPALNHGPTLNSVPSVHHGPSFCHGPPLNPAPLPLQHGYSPSPGPSSHPGPSLHTGRINNARSHHSGLPPLVPISSSSSLPLAASSFRSSDALTSRHSSSTFSTGQPRQKQLWIQRKTTLPHHSRPPYYNKNM